MASKLNVTEIQGTGTSLPINGAVLDFSNAQDYMNFPGGTTSNRPSSPVEGSVRWNYSDRIRSLEVYDGTRWKPIDLKFTEIDGMVQNGLIVHLDAGNLASYPGFGDTWLDLTENHYNGAASGSPTWNSNGYFNNDYSNDKWYLRGMENYRFPQGVTVSVWHYNGGGTGYYRGVVTNGTTADRTGGIDLRYGRENVGSGGGSGLYWGIKDAANITRSSVTIDSPPNQWGNYVGTYDNTTVVGYRNGSEYAKNTHRYGGELYALSDSITIGHSPNTSEYLDGNLAIVSIYDRALTAEEVSQNFEVFRNRFGI